MLRSMAMIDGLSVVFFLLRIVVKYPLLISSHNPMQKIFSLLSLNQLFASEKSLSTLFSVSVHKAPNFLVFESFPWLSIVQKWLVTPNDSASSSLTLIFFE